MYNKEVKIKSKKHSDIEYLVLTGFFNKLVYDNKGYYYGSYIIDKDNQEILSECDSIKEL